MKVHYDGDTTNTFDVLDVIRDNTAPDMEPMTPEDIHALLTLEVGQSVGIGIVIVTRDE